MEKYPLLARRNIPAYLVVASLWIGCAAVMAFALRTWSDAAVPWSVGAVWSLLAVMLGMSVMFGASVVNLRKLRPGFERLAAGAGEPSIPTVWCPVLTMAIRATLELSQRVSAPRGPRQGHRTAEGVRQ